MANVRVLLRDWLLKPSAEELAAKARERAEWVASCQAGTDPASLMAYSLAEAWRESQGTEPGCYDGSGWNPDA